MKKLYDLIPETVIGATLIVVVLAFLNHLQNRDIRLHEISDKCHDTQVEIQSGYENSLARIIKSQGDQTDRIIQHLTVAEGRMMEQIRQMKK